MIQTRFRLRVIPKARPIVTRFGARMPKAYVEQKKLLQLKLKPFKMLHGELSLDCMFVFKKSKTNAKNKMSMPVSDTDNLIGAIMDAGESILYENDRQIVEIHAKKIWGDDNWVFIELKEI